LVIRRDARLARARMRAVAWNLVNLHDVMERRVSIQSGRVYSDRRFLKNCDWKMAVQS
jgi:hypothetical protein